MKTLYLVCTIALASCASAPSKREVSKNHLAGQAVPTEKAEQIEKALTLGVNQMQAGYSAEVTLFTEPLIIAQETEKGKMNMDTDAKIKQAISKNVNDLVKDKMCFSVRVHTYSIEEATFSKNWVAKLKDGDGSIQDLVFRNVSGAQSVPETYQDMNGRRWHNSSFACGKPIDTSKSFTVFLIPQMKNNDQDRNGTAELTWTVK